MPVVPPGGCSGYAPCQNQAGYGDPGAWSNQSAYTQVSDVDNVTCTASLQGWQATGVFVPAGDSLSVIAGGEAEYSASGYAYPEGSYPGGGRHSGPPSAGPAPGGDFGSNPILSLIGPAQALALKFTATDVAPAWMGHDTGLAFPGRSSIVLASQINGGAGGYVWVCQNDNVYGDNGCCFNASFRVLSPNSTGTVATYQYTAQTAQVGCECVITLTLVDNSGNPVELTAGETQAFTLVDLSGTGQFFPSPNVTMEPGQSSVQIAYTNPNTGTYNVQVLVGPGILQTVSPVPGTMTLACVIPCSNTDPIGTLCSITRPVMRDVTRRILGQIPPVDASPFGAAGADSIDFPYPYAAVLNMALGEALAEINRRCNLHVTLPIQIPVSPVSGTYTGPQFIPLAGIIGCPVQLSVNTVRRATFTANGQYAIRLIPTNYWQLDSTFINFDNYTGAQVPYYYWVDGGNIALIPPVSQAGGILTIYAGTSFPGFASDSDTIDQLPSDFQMIIGKLAAYLICTYRPSEPDARQRMQDLLPQIAQGIKDIARWHSFQAEEVNPRLVARTGKRIRNR